MRRQEPLTRVMIRTGDRIERLAHRKGHEYSVRGLDRFQRPEIWGWYDWQAWDGQAEPLAADVRYPAPTQTGMAAADVDESATFNPEMRGRDARPEPQY